MAAVAQETLDAAQTAEREGRLRVAQENQAYTDLFQGDMRAQLEAGKITVDDIKAATATPAGMAEDIEQHQIVRANSVTLVGLTDVRYNGKTGRVVKLPDQQNGRVKIELDDPVEPALTAINVYSANILSSASADALLSKSCL